MEMKGLGTGRLSHLELRQMCDYRNFGFTIGYLYTEDDGADSLAFKHIMHSQRDQLMGIITACMLVLLLNGRRRVAHQEVVSHRLLGWHPPRVLWSRFKHSIPPPWSWPRLVV